MTNPLDLIDADNANREAAEIADRRQITVKVRNGWQFTEVTSPTGQTKRADAWSIFTQDSETAQAFGLRHPADVRAAGQAREYEIKVTVGQLRDFAWWTI